MTDKKMLRFCFCALIAIFVIPSAILAASFDCSKASTKTEKAICGDPMLSQLDNELSVAYDNALKTGDRNGIKKSQRKWLKDTLASCQEDKACIKNAYESRIHELSPAIGDTMMPEQYLGKWKAYSNAFRAVYGDLEVKNHSLSFKLLGSHAFVVVATLDDSVVLEMSESYKNDCGRYIRLEIIQPNSDTIHSMYVGSLLFVGFNKKNEALAPKRFDPRIGKLGYLDYCTYGLYSP